MAIYGDFEYHAFNDIIKVLQRHTGVLFMRTALGGRSVEMHLRDGTLNAMFIDGFPVTEPLRIRETISSLTNSAAGEYSFEAGQITPQIAVPLSDLIRDVVSTANIPDQQLPHQETRFEWQPQAAQVNVPEALQSTWASAGPLLKGGASATDLAQQLHIGAHEARVTLYRLRAAGLITPQRAAGAFRDPHPQAVGAGADMGAAAHGRTTSMATPSSPSSSQPQQQAGPVRRLLNALRRLTGGNAV